MSTPRQIAENYEDQGHDAALAEFDAYEGIALDESATIERTAQ